ncbi:MAG: DUF6188 family protein [Phycisphaerae bacterium]
MHGLPVGVDLSFFRGRQLLQVCVGLNDVILNFDNGVSLSIQTSISHHSSTGKATIYEEYTPAATMLMSLLHQTIVGVRGDKKGTLHLEFSEGDCIHVYDSSEQYESYQIKHRGGEIIV